VRDYLGDSILLRRRAVFLGAANALAIPLPRLLPLLDIIQESCHSEPLHGLESRAGEKEIPGRGAAARRNDTQPVYAFLDPSPALAKR
jgi:hypothetical protein